MRTEQILYENNKLELSIKRPTHFVIIFLLSAASLCIIVPLVIFFNLLMQSEEGFRIQSFTIVLSLIPILFGLFLMKTFLLNFYGKEIYIFEETKIRFWTDYKFFKTEKLEFKIKKLKFNKEQSGFDKEEKAVLMIETDSMKHKSKVELNEQELNHLIEELNINIKVNQ